MTAPITEAPVSGGTPAPETPEGKKKMSLKNKLLIAGASVALAAVAGTGIGISAASSGEKAPEATSTSAPAHPSHSAEPTQEATPSAAPTTPETTAPVPMPENLKIYQAMEVQGFGNLPEDERIAYWAQIVGGPDGMRTFADDFYRISGDPRDKLPATISENNTPQEIGTIASYALRIPYSLAGEDRQKALYAAIYYGNTSSIWEGDSNAVANDPENESGGAVAYNHIADAYTITGGSAVTHSNNETYVDLQIKTDNGETGNTRAYYVTTEYNGQPMSWWVLQ